MSDASSNLHQITSTSLTKAIFLGADVGPLRDRIYAVFDGQAADPRIDKTPRMIQKAHFYNIDVARESGHEFIYGRQVMESKCNLQEAIKSMWRMPTWRVRGPSPTFNESEERHKKHRDN
ncbi:hypothetical protein E4U44_006771 [Claviceps purpurea]|nr:hypothetical protein E4U44_006771 [Claviceps purpurea]